MHASEKIRTKDGARIWTNLYMPESEIRAVVVLSPAAKLSQKHYYASACFLRDSGFAVVSFDYRGRGDSVSKRLPGLKTTISLWAMQDLDAVLRFVKNRYPGREVIYVGHGIGGEIVGLAPASQFIDRIILVNAGLSCNRLRSWTRKIWIDAFYLFVSGVSWLSGFYPLKRAGSLGGFPKGVVAEWIRWSRNENGLFDDFSDHNYRKLQVPVLSLNFSDDWRAGKNAVNALLEHFSLASVDKLNLEPADIGMKRTGHTGFLQEEVQKSFWSLVISWINGTYINSALQIHKA